jgi:hypothetical protein
MSENFTIKKLKGTKLATSYNENEYLNALSDGVANLLKICSTAPLS